MKIFKNILFLIVVIVSIVFSNSSCERDDICAEGTPTTPFLIIKFIDNETQIETDIKRPSELQVRAVGFDSIIDIGTVTDSIMIPLRTNTTSTAFEFTINSDTTNDTTPPNTDIISFEYEPIEEYVSSACGFRVVYNAITANEGEEGDDGDWIKGITERTLNVTDETAAHIFIFH
ncbi:DUF6452 family protein [Aquimarina gracilis]|uniref:DUF6452 family protein n=1 Tax=Aquimarina gracilis TaxID=874422 RepID=A0ABU6A1G0_9FLAO|nr:DUF6452 family protein [Aquimarina gracilis]MEB3347926.1 DUF6452 family protein [Aquimarina gracilis]